MVDLEGVHEARALEQRPRELAVGGPDLEDHVVGRHRRLLHDGAQDVAVDEMVLAVAVQGVRPRGATAVARGLPVAAARRPDRARRQRRRLATVIRLPAGRRPGARWPS